MIGRYPARAAATLIARIVEPFALRPLRAQIVGCRDRGELLNSRRRQLTELAAEALELSELLCVHLLEAHGALHRVVLHLVDMVRTSLHLVLVLFYRHTLLRVVLPCDRPT